MLSDATHSYRGYRQQALYALHRILSGPSQVVYQPEGEEDFAVLNSEGSLIEVDQVKSYSENIVLSHFKPDKPDSFFYRTARLLDNNPSTIVTIVSYGQVGPELAAAVKQEGKDRHKVAEKLKNYKFLSKDRAYQLLGSIQIRIVSEENLRREIDERLRSSFTGVDPKAAFELLTYWLYDCSEHKRKITQQDVINQINYVGRFLAGRAAYLQEWGTTILPIEDGRIEESEQNNLAEEFYRGVSTTYNHILANLDVVRWERLEEIDQKFKKARVVIIHGASGQGKTTLAYRYLHDYFPDFWRFRIQRVEDRQHAVRIATALLGHADALNLPIAVFIDVRPTDRDWIDVARELSVHRNIRLLISVREEDFQRATLSGAELLFEQVDLEFNQAEAQSVFLALTSRQTSSEFVHFEDAWLRFGESGPLMEFVYLVTQGNTLRERLAQQVAQLEDQVRRKELQPEELQLLRLISVAAAYEARLKVQPLARTLNLAAPKRTFQLFEKEYFFRLSEDQSLVGGLHPIRSMLLTELLTDSVFETWETHAQACLPIVNELDIEIFLLYAFSRRPANTEAIIEALADIQPSRWTAIAGITRALLWLGVREYVTTNRSAIDAAFKDSGRGWQIVLDPDLADAIPGTSESILNLLPPSRRERVAAIQAQQTDKRQVFTRVETWLTKQTKQPLAPQSEREWAELGEVLYWLGRLGITLPLSQWLPSSLFDSVVDELSIERLADLCLGLSEGYPLYFVSWLDKNRQAILRRFRQMTRTIGIEDDGENITAHFLIPLEPSRLQALPLDERIEVSKNRFNAEAVYRIRLLLKLFPNYRSYGCRGYGHNVLPGEMPYDDTVKSGVERRRWPPSWLTSVNVTFRGLIENRYRPSAWLEFSNVVMTMRQENIAALRRLEQILNRYFQSRELIVVVNEVLETDLWSQCTDRLNHPPFLPINTTDEWGFFGESIADEIRVDVSRRNALASRNAPADAPYQPFLKAFRDYTTNLSSFFEQSTHTMAINPFLGRTVQDAAGRARVLAVAAEQGRREDAARLSVLTLAEAVKAVPQFQTAFRQLLHRFVDLAELTHLEAQEAQVYGRVWKMWYVFATQPERTAKHSQALLEPVNAIIPSIRRALQKAWRKSKQSLAQIQILGEDISWGGSPALWLTIDSEDATDTFNALEDVVVALRDAVGRIVNEELRDYLLSFHWPQIIVLPLLRGKSIAGVAWQWHTATLIKDAPLSWWQVVPVPIPLPVLEQLNISIWKDERLQLAQSFLSHISDLTTYATHVRDLLRAPEFDDEGTEQIRAYALFLGERMSEIFQAVIDSYTDMLNQFTQLSTDEQMDRPNLFVSIRLLTELKDNLLPTSDYGDSTAMNLPAMAEWAERLIAARERAGLAYLFWMTDVVDLLTNAS